MTENAEHVVRVEGLRKSRGERQVLDGLSFTIGCGRVFGLIGPNGAGKTTTIKILLGLLAPDDGVVEVFGTPPMRLPAGQRQRIGYLSEEDRTLPDLPIAELLEYHSHFFARWDWDRCRGLIDRIGVPEGRSLHEMSKGERRKAQLAVALAHGPDLLILDDPAIGLDARVRRDILWATVGAASEAGCTVLFTSHILQDVERIVDDVLILKDGKARSQESLDALKERTRRLVFRGRAPVGVPGEVERRAHGADTVVVTDGFTPELGAALRRDHPGLEVEGMNLEEIFCAVFGAAAGESDA